MSMIYKQYNLVCNDCEHEFKTGLWKRDGEFENPPSCPKCESDNISEYQKNSYSGPMINTREDWKKKLPGGYKEFMGEFKKRHSKYGRTIND
jgi:NAD-dependent SIR2 family protein deacetylase